MTRLSFPSFVAPVTQVKIITDFTMYSLSANEGLTQVTFIPESIAEIEIGNAWLLGTFETDMGNNSFHMG